MGGGLEGRGVGVSRGVVGEGSQVEGLWMGRSGWEGF